LQPVYNAEGERTLRTVDQVQTNDRGEYRLYFVTPGRYYVGADGMQPRNTTTALQRTANQIPMEYASDYYPGVTSTASATIIEVKPTVGGIDFAVRRQLLFLRR